MLGQRGPAPQAAPARVLQVLLLQWCWQQPTWQAAACTHRSLLFVHCQGKGAGGRAEGEEGTGNYKNQQKKERSLQRPQLGFRETCTCCLQTPARLPPVNIYTANTTPPEKPALQLSSCPGAGRAPGTTGTARGRRAALPPAPGDPTDAHSSLWLPVCANPPASNVRGARAGKYSRIERKGGKKRGRGVKKDSWVPPPRRGVSPPVCQVRGSPALQTPPLPGGAFP